MRTFKLLVPVAAAVLLRAGGAVALDSPHDGSFLSEPQSCDSCHLLHGSAGGTLTKYPSNNYGCIVCHGTGVDADSPFAGSANWLTGREATTSSGTGDSHNWSLQANGAGAHAPLNADMAKYVPTDTATLQCAACHDLHGKRDATGSIQQTLAPNSAHSSYKVGKAYDSGNLVQGQLTVTSITNAKPAGYRIIITTGGASGFFKFSTNAHTATPTWTENVPYGTGVMSIPGDANLKIQFSLSPLATAEWSFYVSYPFLRAANSLDQMCLDCHRDRNQTHDCVKGVTCTADGLNQVFSHPVGEALQTNDGTHTHDYDLAAPLDADGTAQYQANEANPSNALNLVGGKVSCTTCHAPHNADSNSLSVDNR